MDGATRIVGVSHHAVSIMNYDDDGSKNIKITNTLILVW